jgi:hypothetical protein
VTNAPALFHRPSRTSALAGLALILVAGCGGGDRSPRPTETPGTPAERPGPSDVQQITDLLDERGAALEAGERRAYVATATGAQRRRDRIDARRARHLRFREVTLEADSVDVSGDRATVRVAAGYAIEGVRGTFEFERRLRAARTPEGWRVSAAAARRGRAPWEVDDLRERRTEHFVILAPPDVPVDELVVALEDGYATMSELLSRGRLRRRYLVVVATGPQQARALTLEIRGVETLAALADASVIQNGPAGRTDKVVSMRMVVVWEPFATLDAEGRRRVVTHELTHAALTGSTSGRTPAWLSEGVALYVSGDRRSAPPGADIAALSRPDAIARLTGEAQSAAYSASSAAAFAIAERFGTDRLLELYDAFNDPRLQGKPGPKLVNRALRRELGITLADVV